MVFQWFSIGQMERRIYKKKGTGSGISHERYLEDPLPHTGVV